MAITPRHHARPGIRALGPRGLVALLLALGLLAGSAACGFDVQTNRPYTPAQGVNDDVGDPPVQVRNLMVLSRESGVGFVSATITATERDALVGITGRPVKADYSFGEEFTVLQADPIALAPGAIVVLTNLPLIQLKSPALEKGLEAEITLTFSNAGELTRRVPVVDANEQPYRSISPSPSTAAN